MQLLDLPSEILIIIYKALEGVRALYALTQTCTCAQEVYTQNSLSITETVASNAYPGLGAVVVDTVSAMRSFGDLDYAYLREHEVQWILPQACELYTASLSLLRALTNLVSDTENLADWCVTKCRQKSVWYRGHDQSLRQSVVETLWWLQLVTNRMYNVRLLAFPEQTSLRAQESEGSIFPISRRTRDQAHDLMNDQLRVLDSPSLRNIWMLMQVLQEEYLLLRRHRLRPKAGSLLDLLFQHGSGEHGWRISPWFPIQNLLSERGIHVSSPRPGTVIRFLGQEPSPELQEQDVKTFQQFVASTTSAESCAVGQIVPVCSACQGCGNNPNVCLHDYLERFRPLLGLAYQDTTAVKSLVRFEGALQPMIVVKKHRAYDSSVDTDDGLLGRMLRECADPQRAIRASKRRNSSRIDR